MNSQLSFVEEEEKTMLTTEEKLLEKAWKDAGVLTPLNADNMPLLGPAVVITCFDTRYFSNWYKQMAQIAGQRQGREVPALFPITFGGAPLVVAPTSPIHSRCDQHGTIKSSLDLVQEHGCHNATVLGHYPCLAGTDNGIGLLENAALLVEGKRWLKAKGMQKPAVLFDIKHDEADACEPWHLCASAFQAWCKEHQPELLEKYPGIRGVI